MLRAAAESQKTLIFFCQLSTYFSIDKSDLHSYFLSWSIPSVQSASSLEHTRRGLWPAVHSLSIFIACYCHQIYDVLLKLIHSINSTYFMNSTSWSSSSSLILFSLLNVEARSSICLNPLHSFWQINITFHYFDQVLSIWLKQCLWSLRLRR